MRFGNETSQLKYSMTVCRPLHESAQPTLFPGPTPSQWRSQDIAVARYTTSLESEAGTLRWGDILSWQGTFGPRTTCPGGQLVLGPHVRGDTWSSYTGHQQDILRIRIAT